MNVIVKINNTERTNLIDWESFGIEDNINEQPNLCNFTIRVYEGQNFKPAISDVIEVFDDTLKIFGGKIIRVGSSSSGDLNFYEVEAKDYTLDLDRILVTERFDNKTGNEVVTYIISNYLAGSGVTHVNTNCPITINVIVFDQTSISKCLTELCELLNYSWYIDYDKDIHLFAKNDKPAPFNLTDENDSNYIRDSLVVDSDLSQLRNVVIIEGGEITSDNPRTSTQAGNGSKKSFATDYKFSDKPTVKVNGVAMNVGVDFLDNDVGFDCLWNFNEKYIRFVNAPASGAVIEISGKYLIPIMVQVEDEMSIAQYGRFEFSKVDKNIKSAEEAKMYGEAQLGAYAFTIREGAFRTYESGLSSGQTIQVNLSNRNIAESFLIMRVSLKMLTASHGEWTAELATMRTLGIISFLQKLLIDQKKKLTLNEDVVLKKYYVINETVEVAEEIGLKIIDHIEETVEVTEEIMNDPFGAGVPPDFVVAPYKPTSNTDPKREFKLDRCTLG
ncbi:MAG: hypothetical protein NT165_03720 [Candidatus Falkowbacteria bacterium]|nr:hypothetical protein [Candidatus Falkowbacteria bacterium]